LDSSKTMQFYLNYTSNFSKKSFLLKELSFKQLKTLNKFIQNKNDTSIIQAFENILYKNIINKKDYIFLNNFDKFCLLFLLRIANISSEIEINKGAFEIKINLLDFFNKIINHNFENLQTVEKNGIKIELDLPQVLYFDDFYFSIYECIRKITFSDKKQIILQNISTENKKKMFEQLPAFVFELVSAYKTQINTFFKHIVFSLGQNDSVNISPFDNSMYETCKALFYINLKSLYDVQYTLVNKVLYTPEYIDKLTFTENILLLKNYHEEIKKTNEETRKQVDNPMQPSK